MSKHTYTNTSTEHTHVCTHTHTHTEHVTKSCVRSPAAQETTAAVLLIAELYYTHTGPFNTQNGTFNGGHCYTPSYKQFQRWNKRRIEERRLGLRKEVVNHRPLWH